MRVIAGEFRSAQPEVASRGCNAPHAGPACANRCSTFCSAEARRRDVPGRLCGHGRGRHRGVEPRRRAAWSSSNGRAPALHVIARQPRLSRHNRSRTGGCRKAIGGTPQFPGGDRFSGSAVRPRPRVPGHTGLAGRGASANRDRAAREQVRSRRRARLASALQGGEAGRQLAVVLRAGGIEIIAS